MGSPSCVNPLRLLDKPRGPARWQRPVTHDPALNSPDTIPLMGGSCRPAWCMNRGGLLLLPAGHDCALAGARRNTTIPMPTQPCGKKSRALYRWNPAVSGSGLGPFRRHRCSVPLMSKYFPTSLEKRDTSSRSPLSHLSPKRIKILRLASGFLSPTQLRERPDAAFTENPAENRYFFSDLLSFIHHGNIHALLKVTSTRMLAQWCPGA